MISGSSVLTVRPQCSLQCPTPGRWNRMHYSSLRGAGFEVSVCIMKAERIRIVMLYGSLVLTLPFCLFFPFSLPCSLSIFLSVTLSLSHYIPFFPLFFFCTFAPLSPPALADTLVYTNTFWSCSLGLLCPCFHLSGRLWLIETGAVKRPHTHSQSWCLTTRRLWFDGPVPELASPWRGSALGFPVNEALCGWEG